MFLSPLSTPLKFYLPEGKGVYCTPHSFSAPTGWGEPRMTPEGARITPGTLGGPQPNALIKRDGTVVTSKYLQQAGNISWHGPWYDSADQSKGRRVVSVNGPATRYFKDEGFTYGDDPRHNEVYYLGAYADVAPGPVLGAAMRKMPYVPPSTTTSTDVWWLLVVAYVNGADRFYRKRYIGPIKAYGMTDEVRAGSMALYHPTLAPDGWQTMGVASMPADAYQPETPWFFNESATKACHLRRNARNFSDGANDRTESAFERHEATIGEATVNVVNLGNLPPYEFTHKVVKTKEAYTSVKNYPAYCAASNGSFSAQNPVTHTFREDFVTVNVGISGSQVVLCDYSGNDLILGKLTYAVVHTQAACFTYGDDPQPYNIMITKWDVVGDPPNHACVPANELTDMSIFGYMGGPRWEANNPTNFDYLPKWGDHFKNDFIKLSGGAYLEIGTNGNFDGVRLELMSVLSGTSDQWEGNPRQDDNPYVYFQETYHRYPIGMMDARYSVFCVKDVREYLLLQNTPARLLNTKLSIFSELETDGRHYFSYIQPTVSWLNFGWTTDDMLTWANTIDVEVTRTTYEAVWPTDNRNGELQQPGTTKFFLNTTPRFYIWPTLPELLYGPQSVCKGNGVATEHGWWAVNLQVPNPVTGEDVLVSDTLGRSSVESTVGFGDISYPLGIC